MKNLKQLSLLTGILAIHQLLTLFVKGNLDPIKYSTQNLFVAELIGKSFNLPVMFLSFFDLGNIILFWLIAKKFFTDRFFSIIPPIIYAISLWGSYLVAGESFYIYLLFLILLIIYSYLLIDSEQKKWGAILFVSATTLAIYNSFLLLITLPLGLILGLFTKTLIFSRFKKLFFFILLLSIPLIFLMFKNPSNLKNISQNEVKLFVDPGLLNMVNSYQGAAKKAKLGALAKLSENKYIIYTEYIFLKYIKSLVPSTFFTSQEKLLNFSFTPPIFLGFVIPFIFSLYLILKSNLRKFFLLSTILVLPSVLSKPMVDLNRLIIFSPGLILIVSYGVILLIKQKNRIASFFIILSLFLIVFQLIVVLTDIPQREKERYVKYYDHSFELGHQ